MLYFANDYTCGAHPEVLRALCETNGEMLANYGFDKYSLAAEEKIRKACACPDAKVYFLSGGTQSNEVVLASLLKSYEGAVSAVTGHINAHEAGAVEFTGHKVLGIPSHEGKIDADELEDYLASFWADGNHEHMVFPGAVYISHPTEYGTIYSKAELTAISAICRRYDIPLYLDGARLAYALECPESDVTLPDLAALCDAFYIGGTKCGTLSGEAVVFPRRAPKYFLTTVKQHGAMLAKSRLCGVQFDALFTDDLYFRIGRLAAHATEKLRAILAAKGCRFFINSPTNQQFVVLENDKLAALEGKTTFSVWEKFDEGHTVVRFAVSWATSDADLDALEKLL